METAASVGLQWFATWPLSQAVRLTGNLFVYTELNMLMGDRGTTASRIDEAGACYALLVAGSGGQLTQVVRSHFYSGVADGAASAAMLTPEFLHRSPFRHALCTLRGPVCGSVRTRPLNTIQYKYNSLHATHTAQCSRHGP